MSDTMDERRRARRRAHIKDHGIIAARVRPGYDAVVLDVSSGGALVESPHRLLPGTTVELQLQTMTHRMAVRGRVVRCEVTRLRSSAVCYQGAIAFEHQLSLFTEEGGYRMPAPEEAGVDPSRSFT